MNRKKSHLYGKLSGKHSRRLLGGLALLVLCGCADMGEHKDMNKAGNAGNINKGDGMIK